MSRLLAVAGIAEAGSLARYARHVPGISSSKGALRAGWRAETQPVSGAGLTLPTPAARSATGGRLGCELIDRCGKAPVIEAALAHRTGRPRPLPVRAVLTALFCLALDDRPLFLDEATRLLFCRLNLRRLLGVAGPVTTQRAFLAACRRVRYCFGAICSVMDPSPLPKNRRLSKADLTGPDQADDTGPGRAARGRLEAFINALTEASISVLNGAERAAFDGWAGLDATPVPLSPRPVPARRPVASDPDGGWYVREGDHREREDDEGRPLRKISGRWRPPSPPRPRRPARRLRIRISPSAWRWPGPARTPAAPAPGSWPPRRPRPQGRLARLRPRVSRAARALPAPARALGYRPSSTTG